MVCESPRTHGNKTRISSFTESRTTICATCHPPIPTNTASPLVFLCPFTPTSTKPLHQRAPSGYTCHGVTPGPCMSHPHRLLPNTALTSKCLSCFSLSLLATGFPITPPKPGPAPSSASGFRPSGLCTPVSPGVPTGARNLGVCVCVSRLLLSYLPSATARCTLSSPTCRFAPNLCYCLSTFSLRFSATALSFFHNPLSTPHPLLPPPLLSFTPSSHAPSCFPCILPTNPTGPPCHPFGASGEGG